MSDAILRLTASIWLKSQHLQLSIFCARTNYGRIAAENQKGWSTLGWLLQSCCGLSATLKDGYAVVTTSAVQLEQSMSVAPLVIARYTTSIVNFIILTIPLDHLWQITKERDPMGVEWECIMTISGFMSVSMNVLNFPLPGSRCLAKRSCFCLEISYTSSKHLS